MTKNDKIVKEMSMTNTIEITPYIPTDGVELSSDPFMPMYPLIMKL